MIDNTFILHANTNLKFVGEITLPITNAVNILNRDIKKTLEDTGHYPNEIVIQYLPNSSLEQEVNETFTIQFTSQNGIKTMDVIAYDELGIIYGLLYISQRYLGVESFWFFNDKEPVKKEYIEIDMEDYVSSAPRVRYRGWFINDEVLLNGWKGTAESENVWSFVFETLLRCGANMVIAGTDRMASLNRHLASGMGLYITHHHAEPLGAELFLRVYPNETPSYTLNGNLFDKIWEDAVIAQKDIKVIWNVGFRGQGDYAFWANDPSYQTGEVRGKLISNVIKKQIEIVKKHCADPVFCTNIYGEIMELYAEGHIDIPEQVIKIWADNGYGKMVSRRQHNHNPRVYALPTERDKKPNGMYYHVSFHDLQASNLLTMIPNRPEFVKREFQAAFEAGADEYVIVNCGNIKPHTYMLGLVSKIWQDGYVDVARYLKNFTDTYYPADSAAVERCYQAYFENQIEYGPNPDDRAGEEFYHYIARSIVCHWMGFNRDVTEKSLLWATGSLPFAKQVNWYKTKCEQGVKSWSKYKQECLKVEKYLKRDEKQLFFDTILLQSIIHDSGCRGAVKLCLAYEAYAKQDYLCAFMHATESLRSYREGILALQQAEHDKWVNYYKNDCLTNIKLTIYVIDSLRRYLRILGDGPIFNTWEKEQLYSETERHIMLQTAYFNQLSDDELYEKIKAKVH